MCQREGKESEAVTAEVLYEESMGSKHFWMQFLALDIESSSLDIF